MFIHKCAVCGFEAPPDSGVPPCQHTPEEWAAFCEGKEQPVQRWLVEERPDAPGMVTGLRRIREDLHKNFPQLRGSGLIERSVGATQPFTPSPPPFPIPPREEKK